MALPRKKADIAPFQVQPKSALMAKALQRATRLSAPKQDALATQILDILQDKPDPAIKRFQDLIEFKYTRGLTLEESAEVKRLEAGFQKDDEAFYRPILQRLERLANR